MNKTLAGLRLAGLRSPVLVNPIRSTPSFTSINSFHLSKSFNTFIYERSLFGELSVKNSKFNKFLSQVIRSDSNYDVVGRTLTDHITVYGHLLNIIVMDTSFTHCSTAISNGGAIFFDRKSSAIRIDRCLFQKCNTKKTGGAFYCIVDNATISRTCFDQCIATEAAHAFYICTHIRDQTVNTSQCSISQCASNAKLTGKAAIVTLTGEYRNTFINATRNHALGFTAFYGAIASLSASLSFSNVANSSCVHILRFTELNDSIVLGFCNILGNKASISLIQSSARNNMLNCIFLENQVNSICTGVITYLQMSDCVLDVKYSFHGLAYVRTPGIQFNPQAKPIVLRIEFASGCKILDKNEGTNITDHVTEIIDQIPKNNHKLIDLHQDRLLINIEYPTVRLQEPEIESIPIIQENANKTGQSGRSPKSRGRTTHHSQFIITPFAQPKRLSSSWAKDKRLFAPTEQFSPTDTFIISRTFLPSLQFTASVSPAQSLVPYVLYSAAGFVIFGVLTSFLFLRSSDTGYNLMTPSESADSRVSDYASSTSTTMTITGESSASVVV